MIRLAYRTDQATDGPLWLVYMASYLKGMANGLVQTYSAEPSEADICDFACGTVARLSSDNPGNFTATLANGVATVLRKP